VAYLGRAQNEAGEQEYEPYGLRPVTETCGADDGGRRTDGVGPNLDLKLDLDMKTRLLLTAALAVPLGLQAASSQLLGWNNLGMHCMDSDYSVFSILPPYNTIEAQLIVNGRLVTNDAGNTVSYQALADPSGSLNTTARGKGNFYDFVLPLYGAAVSPEAGLTPWHMPGTNNTPQAMLFEPTNRPAPGVATLVHWFRAEGIPITPYDDAGGKNPYPMMRLIARTSTGTPLATNDIVLPVSDEMDCRACHASGANVLTQPAAGWVWSGNPERDFRLNILRLHDQYQFALYPGLYQAALAARGFNPQGLYRGVVADAKPVLCAICHASEALGTGSFSNIPPLTASMHGFHAQVPDPVLNVTLDDSSHRAACYRCHPGSTTKCLRGAMGGAVGADGAMEMQCQSCHGNMSAVGASSRVGWFMEPNCQGCHTGTATSNNGKIRYTSCFESNGAVRVPVNPTFATTPDTPAAGLSLFRFSRGHGGLQCSACHGSTHAEFPATHRNDNLRNERIQAHPGVTIECATCHTAMPSTVAGGPHGMHPLGNNWALNHGDLFEGTPPAATRQQCQTCHGANYRGTVLSRAQASRSLSTKFGSRTLWRGQQIGCYDCHNGPNSSDPSANTPPVVSDVSADVLSGASVAIPLPGSDANGNPLIYRVVAQAAHGSVGVSNHLATYFAEPGYVGPDTFSFAANDGFTDSNLGQGVVAVGQGPFSIDAQVLVPPSWPAGWPAPLGALVTPSNTTVAVTYGWDFGDGSAPGTNRHSTHTYATSGAYQWTFTARASTAQTTVSGSILITSPISLTASRQDQLLTLAWPVTPADAVLEQTPSLPAIQWKPSTNGLWLGPTTFQLDLPTTGGSVFYRVRLAQ
jgi:hypothetical protein